MEPGRGASGYPTEETCQMPEGLTHRKYKKVNNKGIN